MSTQLKVRDQLLDRLERYYKEDAQLSETDLAICSRYELAFGFMQKAGSRKAAISKYIKALEKQNITITKNTAYQDFKNAETLMLPLHKTSKDLHRIVTIELIDRDIAKIKQRQNKDDITDSSFNNYQERLEKLYALRIKATGIEHDDSNMPDFSNLQPPQLEINLSDKTIQFFQKFMQSGVVDTTEMMKAFTEEAEIIEEEEAEDE